MSLRETVIAAAAAALVAANVASGRVYRSRQEAIETTPSVVVEPLAEDADETVLGMLDATLTLGVTVYAKGKPADGAADATLAAARAALQADRTLGLGSEVQVLSRFTTEWAFDDYDVCRATLSFQISMRTAL